MAINIGSNFNYQGQTFLDGRQGEAKTLRDLLEWDILVPEGFEVNVDGDWYTYDTSYYSPITGKFKKRPGFEEFCEIDNKVFPLTFSSFSQVETYEVGQKIWPMLSWTLSRKGQAVSPSLALVNGSVDGVAEDKLSYSSQEYITSNTDYTVLCRVESGAEVSKTVSYKFYNKKFYGVSAKASIDTSDISGFTSVWATSWTLPATTFNCTGGMYPYYLIPTSLYNPSTFRMWISGLRNTDMVVSNLLITNAYGVDTDYTVIRLGTLQHGSPVITFAN